MQYMVWRAIITKVSINALVRVGFSPLFFKKLLRRPGYSGAGRNESESSMSKITEKVTELAGPVVEDEGCSLWDVEYIREAGSWYLRIYIDKAGGVSIDDCERISRRLDPLLDEADPIPDSYVFEVGSAGAERELKRPGDFEQFMGSEVEVRLYQPVNGCKVYIGRLAGYKNGTVTVTVGDRDMSFGKSQTSLVKLHVSI